MNTDWKKADAFFQPVIPVVICHCGKRGAVMFRNTVIACWVICTFVFCIANGICVEPIPPCEVKLEFDYSRPWTVTTGIIFTCESGRSTFDGKSHQGGTWGGDYDDKGRPKNKLIETWRQGKLKFETTGNTYEIELLSFIDFSHKKPSYFVVVSGGVLGETIKRYRKYPYIKSMTTELMGKDKPDVTPLIAALKDEDEHVQYEAARALGEIKDRRAVEPLDCSP